MALAHEEAWEPQPKEDDNTASAEPSSTHSTRLAGRSNRAVSPLLPGGRAVPAWMDARSCIRHGSWKAGCITKGACPVWKAGIGNRRQQCRTALVLDLTLHSAGQGLHLPGGDHGLAQQESAELAAVQYDGRDLLRRGPRGSLGPLRPTGDLQQRPGRPVYHSPACWRPPASGSAWTAKAAAWIMFSWSACGAASSTRRSCAVNALSRRET